LPGEGILPVLFIRIFPNCTDFCICYPLTNRGAMMRMWRNGREIVEMQSMHIRITFSGVDSAAGAYL
jgi:hypothetical protein